MHEREKEEKREGENSRNVCGIPRVIIYIFAGSFKKTLGDVASSGRNELGLASSNCEMGSFRSLLAGELRGAGTRDVFAFVRSWLDRYRQHQYRAIRKFSMHLQSFSGSLHLANRRSPNPRGGRRRKDAMFSKAARYWNYILKFHESCKTTGSTPETRSPCWRHR